jgi:hypothetical protein
LIRRSDQAMPMLAGVPLWGKSGGVRLLSVLVSETKVLVSETKTAEVIEVAILCFLTKPICGDSLRLFGTDKFLLSVQSNVVAR